MKYLLTRCAVVRTFHSLSLSYTHAATTAISVQSVTAVDLGLKPPPTPELPPRLTPGRCSAWLNLP
jgi:hypothetical protein